MQTLVTGGGGFLGLYIVEQLLQQGHAVRVFSRGQYPALKALGVGPGDEVVVTPRTFIASISCVVNAGAVPVFADVDADMVRAEPEQAYEDAFAAAWRSAATTPRQSDGDRA